MGVKNDEEGRSMSPNRAKKMASSDVRAHNLGLLLREIAHRGQASRSHLTRATGLSAASVTGLVNEALELHLIEPADDKEARPSEPGRAKTLFRIARSSFAVGLIELRLDCARTVLVTGDQQVLIDNTAPIDFRNLPLGDFVSFAAQTVRSFTRAAHEHGIAALPCVGVIIPGPIEQDGRTLYMAIDYGWARCDVAGAIEEELGALARDMHIQVFNDANASLLAEYHHLLLNEEEPRPQDLLYFKNDVGFGGAAIIGGRPFTGAYGVAVEPGHVQVHAHGEQCGCGKRGCLATTASPEAMIGHAGLEDLAEKRGQDAAMDELARLAQASVEPARSVMRQAITDVRRVLTNSITMFSPDHVFFGGYLAEHVDAIADDPILRALCRDQHIALAPAFCGKDGALTGAYRALRLYTFEHASALLG